MSRVLLVVMGLGAGVAAASDETWGLTWRAPEGCMQAAELAERVERKIGRPLFMAQARRSVDGYLAQEPTTWRARLTVVDAYGKVLGTREVEHPAAGCRELDDRVVLLLTLLIRPLLEAPPPPPPPSPPVVIEPPPPLPVRPEPPMPPRRPRLEVRGAERLVDGMLVEHSVFYRRLGRPDLAERYWERASLKSLGLVTGVTLVLASAGFAVASLLSSDCVRWSGTPTTPGTCRDRHSGFVVTSAATGGLGLLSLVWAIAFRTAPTTNDDDLGFVDAFNAGR